MGVSMRLVKKGYDGFAKFEEVLFDDKQPTKTSVVLGTATAGVANPTAHADYVIECSEIGRVGDNKYIVDGKYIVVVDKWVGQNTVAHVHVKIFDCSGRQLYPHHNYC